jgi:Tfp pilus assembly protein PilF
VVEFLGGEHPMKRFCFCLFLLAAVNVQAAPVPIDELPMFGGHQKTDEMKTSDEALLALSKRGSSRETMAKDALKAGFYYYKKGILSSAIKRFNQAWFLDPENGDAYHGFALITESRNGNSEEIEKFYRMALSKPRVSVKAYVDYGRFLLSRNRSDEGLAMLQKALELSSTAKNARANIAVLYSKKGDFTKACEWAKGARVNHDELEPGDLEDMCQRADTK